jgi:hypothetical protein
MSDSSPGTTLDLPRQFNELAIRATGKLAALSPVARSRVLLQHQGE